MIIRSLNLETVCGITSKPVSYTHLFREQFFSAHLWQSMEILLPEEVQEQQ